MPLQSDTNAELDESSGHTAQLIDPGNNTQILEASQALPTGLKRTILDLPFVNNTMIGTAENVTSYKHDTHKRHFTGRRL